MADLSVTFKLALPNGGESVDPNIVRVLTGIREKLCDVVRDLPGGALTSAPTVIWTDSQHGTNPGSALVEPFKCGVFIVDPTPELTADFPISLEVSSTLHLSTNVQNHYFRVTRQNPFIFSSSIVGAMASLTADSTTGFADIDTADTNYHRITRIRAHNPHLTQLVNVRLLLLR